MALTPVRRLLVLALALAMLGSAGGAVAKTRALLVGVSNYPVASVGDLQLDGPKNDVALMIETLRGDQGVVLPAADLLETDPAAILLEGVTDVKDLGSGVIGGQECDHIALRSDELDIQREVDRLVRALERRGVLHR